MPQKTGFGLDAFTLKIIMAVLMVLDHIYLFLPPQPLWYHQASRMVAPLFTFLVAEGMAHTRNRRAYIGRLFCFGLVMLLGNAILMAIYKSTIHNSILISLGVSAALIACIDRMGAGGNIALYTVCIAALVYGSLFFEGAFLCPVMALIFYYLRKRRVLMCVVYAAAMPVVLHFMHQAGNYQLLMGFAVIPIFLYNGKRGHNSPAAKYFFYILYPVHIWVLYIAAQYR